jgi:hypothetical protein
MLLAAQCTSAAFVPSVTFGRKVARRGFGGMAFVPAFPLMTPYEQLLRLAFTAPNDVRYYLTPATLRAYDELLAAPVREQPFRFEQMRLGVAMSLLKLLADLGDHDESRQVLAVLHRALEQSHSPEDIDRIVGREAKLFDQLYANLYVNEEGEELLNLFGQTLDADAPELLEDVAVEGVNLARTLDFGSDDDAEAE